MRRILDVLANQFVVSIAASLDSSLKEFPQQARATLSIWPQQRLADALTEPSIQMLLSHRAILERFTVVLASTMIFPVIRRDELEGRTAITQRVLFEELIPSMLTMWDSVCETLASLEATPDQMELWFKPMLDRNPLTTKEAPAGLHELHVVATYIYEDDLEEVEAAETAMREGIDSMLFLGSQRAFIFDFKNLVHSLKAPGHGSDLNKL